MRGSFDPKVLTGGGRVRIPRGLLVGVAVLLVLLGLSTAVVQVPAGHVGVAQLFGKVYDRALQPGLHVINPLARVTKMDVRTKELKEMAQVPSKEGLSVGTDI